MNPDDQTEAATVEPTAKAPKKPKAGKPAAAERSEAEAVEIPPCPPADPFAGDKTPEVVAWWFQYHPEQAEAKYAGRKFARPE